MNTGRKTTPNGQASPQSTGLQQKSAQTQRAGFVQPKMATVTQTRRPPVAPPPYRPQSAPRVLQAKSHVPQPANPPQGAQMTPAVRRPQPKPQTPRPETSVRSDKSPRQPVVPPVYRPEPKKVVQPKMATAGRAPKAPNAPPVYRPQQAPGVLQAKASQTPPPVAQRKSATPPQAGVAKGVIQRHGGNKGVPGRHVLASGGMIFHGSDIATFTGSNQRGATGVPNAPAWLTGDPEFAMHAPIMMHPSARAYLHNFTARRDITLLAFDDCADLEAYLENNGKPASGGNIGMDAKGVKQLNGEACEGYLVEKDKGRGQPEYVLFAAGLAKLKPGDPIPFDEQATATGDREHHLHGELWGTLENNNDDGGGEPPMYKTNQNFSVIPH